MSSINQKKTGESIKGCYCLNNTSRVSPASLLLCKNLVQPPIHDRRGGVGGVAQTAVDLQVTGEAFAVKTHDLRVCARGVQGGRQGVGLSNAAALNYNQTFIKTLKAVTICPGPNIANFSEVVSLKTMTDHIYGRANILTNNNRPHMFIAELHLYIDYLKEELENDVRSGNFLKRKKYYTSFYQNLCNVL